MSVKYKVEPIERTRPPEWGDLDPSGKRITGQYGKKHRGGIKPEQSEITEENGYTNIVELPPGVSPQKYIDSKSK